MTEQITNVNNGAPINAGSTIKIKGVGFGELEGNAGLRYAIGTYDLTIVSWSDTEVTAIVPNDVPNGTSSTCFVVAYGNPQPQWVGISIPDVSALRLKEPEFPQQNIELIGHTVAGVGGGTFFFDNSDLSAEVAADPLGGVYVGIPSDPTGASGAWVRQLDGYVTPEMFGFITNSDYSDEVTALSNTNAINQSIINCPHGFTHRLSGLSVIAETAVVDRGYITLDWGFELSPSDGFSDDYLVTNTFEDDEDYFRWPLKITQMLLNCRTITRGLYSASMDHVSWSSIRVENAYGSSIFIDRMRESKIEYPVIINSLHRERFANPSDWLSGTNYVVDDYVRVKDVDWDSVTTYSADDIVRDSANRYICKASTTNEQPSLNPLVWQQIPHEDYICVVDNSNKDPQQNNTNSTTEADRVWQKVYQDEACIEVSDIIAIGDRSNQIAMISPIVRDSGNKCYVRVDSSKLPARPITHFDIAFGHIHGQPIAQAGGAIPIPDLQRMLEIGYAINFNVIATNIRIGDGSKGIAVMIGDGGTTKVTQDVRMRSVVVSGDGDDDIGVLVMPSTQASTSSEMDASYLVTSGTSTDIHDPRRIFRKNYKNEQRVLLPAGLINVPAGLTVVGPANEYSTVRPYAYSVSGEAQPHFDFNITLSSTQLRFGAGGSDAPDVVLRRDDGADGILSVDADIELNGNQKTLIPSGLGGTPSGCTVEGPAGEYSLVRPYSYKEIGSSQPRLDVNISSSSSEIRFGEGGSTAPDVILRRNAAGRLSTNAEFRLEGGEWDNGPLILGAYRLWVDGSGNLRIKPSAPTSDTDGVVVGTQT